MSDVNKNKYKIFFSPSNSVLQEKDVEGEKELLQFMLSSFADGAREIRISSENFDKSNYESLFISLPD